MPTTKSKGIILFDGVCNLCTWSVQFVIKRDRNVTFLFSSLQSDYSKKVLSRHNVQDVTLNSVIYQHGEHFYLRSDAVLEILKHLGGGWKLFYLFKILPKKFRDGLYDFIAARRYQWFGKKDQCMVPTRELQARFLD